MRPTSVAWREKSTTSGTPVKKERDAGGENAGVHVLDEHQNRYPPRMPMMTTRLLRSSATSPEASMRGSDQPLRRLMPSTSMASISSRMVRDPRSAHLSTASRRRDRDEHRHHGADLCDSAERHARSGEIGGAQFAEQDVQGERHQNGERDRDEKCGCQRHARDEARLVRNSRHWTGRWNANLAASAVMANNPRPLATDRRTIAAA